MYNSLLDTKEQLELERQQLKEFETRYSLTESIQETNTVSTIMYRYIATSDLSRLLQGRVFSPPPPYVYQLPPYFPNFMLFYVTWPSIQQGLQIDNILVNCLCAHTHSQSSMIWPSIYFYFYWLYPCRWASGIKS